MGVGCTITGGVLMCPMYWCSCGLGLALAPMAIATRSFRPRERFLKISPIFSAEALKRAAAAAPMPALSAPITLPPASAPESVMVVPREMPSNAAALAAFTPPVPAVVPLSAEGPRPLVLIVLSRSGPLFVAGVGCLHVHWRRQQRQRCWRQCRRLLWICHGRPLRGWLGAKTPWCTSRRLPALDQECRGPNALFLGWFLHLLR